MSTDIVPCMCSQRYETLVFSINQIECGSARRSRVSPQQILTSVMTRIVVDKSTDHDKRHFDLFFTKISTSLGEIFFFRARAENGIA